MFLSVCGALMSGYNVAFTLAGTSLLFAGIGVLTGTFDPVYLLSMPGRVYPLITREILIAVPLFVFMGVMLEKSRIAEDLLENMGMLFGPMRGGLGISVIFVGALLAASTGIVGATVVTMGLLSLPTMLNRGYAPSLASASIAASGTLGQIIPPSIVLVILADQISNAFQEAKRSYNLDTDKIVSVGDLFARLRPLYFRGRGNQTSRRPRTRLAGGRGCQSPALAEFQIHAPPDLLDCRCLGFHPIRLCHTDARCSPRRIGRDPFGLLQNGSDHATRPYRQKGGLSLCCRSIRACGSGPYGRRFTSFPNRLVWC